MLMIQKMFDIEVVVVRGNMLEIEMRSVADCE